MRRASGGGFWSPDGRSIVITANLTGRFNLWRIDLDQPFPVQLTFSDEAQDPVGITPDGHVLFIQDQGDDAIWDIHAIPLAGGPAVNLTNTPDFAESEARLSPDGQLIALARRAKTGSSVDIALLDRRTGTVRALTREADATRVWAPVGWKPVSAPSTGSTNI